jgi:quaternary ammonium compound-resistance protein SugE
MVPRHAHLLEAVADARYKVRMNPISASTPAAWTLLLIAGLLEIGWAVGLKYTEGFTRTWPSVLTIGAMIVSMYLLAIAAKTLPIGTAYAVWTGIGTVGAAALGIVIFSESSDWKRILCILLIVAGIVGLKLFK